MQPRLDYFATSPRLGKMLSELSQAVKQASIPLNLIHLADLRASQINGCAFCVDMHVKEAKIRGERELRLYHVAVWRESPLFSPKERAVFEWTEAVTLLGAEGVPDAVYESVRAQLSEQEISDLTFALAVINSWNRLAVSFRKTPGSDAAAYGLGKAGLA
ncbi:MAG: carboxymuconolactone decarboxylase family protein [Fibrobacteres bacterium]|nr:carboxymuconolactone decarboxylase family protein [Fibrobacterota bacterium]